MASHGRWPGETLLRTSVRWLQVHGQRAPFAANIWDLQHMDWESRLVPVVTDLRKVGWSTLSGEQAHALVSRRKRWHPTCCLQAFLVQSSCDGLIQLVDDAARRREMCIERRIAALQSYASDKMNGFGAYLAMFHSEHKRRWPDDPTSFEAGQDAVKTCAEEWKGESVATRQYYARLGQKMGKVKQAVVNEKIEHQTMLLDLKRQERQELATLYLSTNTVSGAKWTDDAFNELEKEWESSAFPAGQVAGLIAERLKYATAPDPAVLKERSAIPAQGARPRPFIWLCICVVSPCWLPPPCARG